MKDAIVLTFVTPVAPHHLHYVDAVRQVVAAQTVPCRHVVVVDDDGRGAGWARNRGLGLVETPFVSFLDADDTIAPTFAEQCLQAFEGTGRKRWVYTDWYENKKRVDAPACAWVRGTWHCVTTLLPTAWARRVNGFDETLTGAEDTAFYMALLRAGYCGTRLAEPLFTYRVGGLRSHAFVHGAQYDATMQTIVQRYGGTMANCCGGETPELAPIGERQETDVLAAAMWAGNRTEHGRATGRLYPRTGNGKQVWVDPRDVLAAPHHWQLVDENVELTDIHALADRLFGGGQVVIEPADGALPPLRVKPDVARILKAAGA